ncbi:MAG: FAD-binding oxidoreductase [Aeromicrobium sp.]
MATDLPAHASVVVIGGGVMGVSTAYHLARAGVRDVVLVERDELGSGSTCKAAGGVRAQFSDAVNIELGQRSLRTFETFREEFGQEIDLHQVGYLFLLDRPDHVAAFERNVALQNELGVPTRMIDVAEAKRMSPLISTDGLLAAAFGPLDGHCTPESVVLGYAGAARRAGATLVRGTTVEEILHDDGTIRGVRTDRGDTATDTVICTAGPWSQAVGAMVGVDLPVTPIRRQILITEAMPGLDPRTPFTIDFASSFYFHGEGQGLLLGMSDPDETPGFKLQRSDDWLPRLGEVIETRAPAIGEVGLASGWAGLYEMTPDHNALIGEADGVSRFLYATGFSGHGFLMGPAVGEVMRDLYLGRPPVVDVSSLGAGRFLTDDTRPELNIV